MPTKLGIGLVEMQICRGTQIHGCLWVISGRDRSYPRGVVDVREIVQGLCLEHLHEGGLAGALW